MGDIDLAQLVLWLGVLLVSLSIHESAHAWSADKLGDPTARYLGRVTLNPLAHIDLFGTVIFPLLSFIAGGVVFGWAKPVPVDTMNLKHPRRDHALVAVAGPVSNLIQAAVFLFVWRVINEMATPQTIGESAVLYPLAELCFIGIQLNVLLAVFNMLPIPPLDGGWVLAGLLPEQAAQLLDAIRPYGFLLLVGLLYTGVLNTVLRPVLAFVYTLI